MKHRILFFVLFFLFLLFSQPASAQTAGVTILAIGDSITAGTAGPSYLCPLKNTLPQATFVGPQPATNCGTPHAGYGGYVSALILSRANEWMPYATGATVVIHVGTNDVNSGFDLDRITIPNIRQIIQKAQSANPRMIILAQIIPSRDNPMTDINSRLAALARETGVRLVNAGNCFRTDTDMVDKDKVHPNDHGAEVIAANIAAAIRGSAPPSVCDQTTALEPPIPVDAVVANQPVEMVKTRPLSDITEGIVQFFFGGSLKPKDIRIPTFNFLPMFKGAVPYLLPKVIQEKTVNAGYNNLYISGKAILCARNPATGELLPKPGTNLYRTEPIQEISEQDSAGRQVAPFFSGYARSPNSQGFYDLRRPPLELANPPGCGEDTTASVQESVSAPTVDQSINFSTLVLSIVRSFFGDQKTAKASATIYSKQVVPYQESSYCLIHGCANETVNLSYLSKEEAKNVQKGGITQANAPKVLDFSEGEMHGGQQSIFDVIGTIQTRIFGSKAIENSTKNLRCSLLPQALQQKEGLDCQTKAAPATACTLSCQTANDACEQFKGQYTESNKGAGPMGCGYTTSGLPGSTAVQNALVTVANYFGVPPKLLAAVLIIENGDVGERGILSYSDATAQPAINEGGFDQYSCKPNRCGAVGPMQLSVKSCNIETSCPQAKDNWKEWCQFRHAANELRGKEGYQPNPANIQDAFAVAAKKFSNYLGNAACPTNLSPSDFYKVGHTYYGNCLDSFQSRLLPNRPGLSAFLQTRATEIIKARRDLYNWIVQSGQTPNHQPSTDTTQPTYCDFLWWYSTTH